MQLMITLVCKLRRSVQGSWKDLPCMLFWYNVIIFEINHDQTLIAAVIRNEETISTLPSVVEAQAIFVFNTLHKIILLAAVVLLCRFSAQLQAKKF